MIVLIVAVLTGLALAPRGRRTRMITPSTDAEQGRARVGVGALLRPVRTDSARHAVECLPELLEATARSTRAGMSVRAALALAAESVPEARLSPVLARVEAGAGLVEELDGWSTRIGHPDAELATAVLLLGEKSGAAVAARLDQTAARLRQRKALADEVRALTVQARASATVVALAPVAFAVVVVVADDRVIGTMFGTAIGRISLVAGLVLDALGVWWMRRLTRVEA